MANVSPANVIATLSSCHRNFSDEVICPGTCINIGIRVQSRREERHLLCVILNIWQ